MHTAQEQYEWMVRRLGWPAYKAQVWARLNVLDGVTCIPHAVVQVARKECDSVDFDAAIARYYDECRAGKVRNNCWVGD